MSLVFNTNLPRNGINWRLVAPGNTSAYQSAINSNVGRTLSDSASLVSSPFANTSAVNSILLSNGDVLCSGNEGLYTFNPVTLEFTYKSNITFLYALCLLDDGNVLCKQGFSSIVIINPNNGTYIRNVELTITASKTIYTGLIAVGETPQTFILNTGEAGKYIVGTIVNVKNGDSADEYSFTGTITAVTSNSITILKSSQTGSVTASYWEITVVGQTASALNTFKSSVVNFQKIPIQQNIYVLTDSSFNSGTFIDTLNWTISFQSSNLNNAFKSSSKYSADTNSYSITFPINNYTKVISTRTTNAVAMSDGNNLLLIHPSGNITNSSIGGSNNIFCLLPQINSISTNQAQGIILLWISSGIGQTWNTQNNTISSFVILGSAPDQYTQPVQLLDGRIFLKPLANNTNPSSFLIFGGNGGFNPNVTLSPYFNKWN